MKSYDWEFKSSEFCGVLFLNGIIIIIIISLWVVNKSLGICQETMNVDTHKY
jgi:hypothetical protein